MNCVALVTDLIFQTKIRGTAQAVGTSLRIVNSFDSLESAVAEDGIDLVIVDLDATRESSADTITMVKSSATKPRVVAFGSHVDGALLEEAKNAGADSVLPRSSFSATLPNLLSGSAK